MRTPIFLVLLSHGALTGVRRCPACSSAVESVALTALTKRRGPWPVPGHLAAVCAMCVCACVCVFYCTMQLQFLMSLLLLFADIKFAGHKHRMRCCCCYSYCYCCCCCFNDAASTEGASRVHRVLPSPGSMRKQFFRQHSIPNTTSRTQRLYSCTNAPHGHPTSTGWYPHSMRCLFKKSRAVRELPPSLGCIRCMI